MNGCHACAEGRVKTVSKHPYHVIYAGIGTMTREKLWYWYWNIDNARCGVEMHNHEPTKLGPKPPWLRKS